MDYETIESMGILPRDKDMKSYLPNCLNLKYEIYEIKQVDSNRNCVFIEVFAKNHDQPLCGFGLVHSLKDLPRMCDDRKGKYLRHFVLATFDKCIYFAADIHGFPFYKKTLM